MARTKKMIRMLDCLVILLSVIMIVRAEDGLERLLWITLFIWQIRCVLLEKELEHRDKIDEILKELNDIQEKGIKNINPINE